MYTSGSIPSYTKQRIFSEIMNQLKIHIEDFAKEISNIRTEIYNEFSLQHEFGMFLRRKLNGYKVQFERNVDFFKLPRTKFIKREIDVVAFSEDFRLPKMAIELKFPRNGQHPEQMYGFCKDLKFAEQLHAHGFDRTAFFVFVDDELFTSGPKKDGIYQYFRDGKSIHGKIVKPTGDEYEEIFIDGSYNIEWKRISEKLWYAFVEIF